MLRNTVVLEIKDNGRGFDPSIVTRFGESIEGIGMRNMRERMERFNGRLNVQSSTNGTMIEARLPRNGKASRNNETNVEAAA